MDFVTFVTYKWKKSSINAWIKTGDKVTFCDNDQNIKEAMFLCSSETEKLHPKKIISNLLNTEDDLTHFCKNYHLESGNFPRYWIHAFEGSSPNWLQLTSNWPELGCENLIQ